MATVNPFGPTPAFTLPSAAGETVSLHDLRGVHAVLHFFPRAGAGAPPPGAHLVRSLLPELASLGARTLGISPHSAAALARLADDPSLARALLSDPDRAVARAYGAVTPAGRVVRSTFLLDRAGTVRWVWRRVREEGHADEVLAMVQALAAADELVHPLLQARRAYRALAKDPVSHEALQRLVEAAHLSPSCFNNQPWRFVVATGETLSRLKETLSGGNYWAQPAPAILAVASKRDLDCKLSDGRDYFLFGCGMAVGLLMIQATQMGLIAHPIAGYDPVAVKEALGIPAEYTLITLIVVGKPGDVNTLSEKHRETQLGPRERKPLSAVLAWNKFGDLDKTEGA